MQRPNFFTREIARIQSQAQEGAQEAPSFSV